MKEKDFEIWSKQYWDYEDIAKLTDLRVTSDTVQTAFTSTCNNSYIDTVESTIQKMIQQEQEKTNMIKEKTEQEKAYEKYLSRKNKYSKYDLKINGNAVILYNKIKKVKQVSVARDEDFDREKGLMMCLLKDMGITYSDIQVMLRNYDKEQAKLMKEKIRKEEEKAKRRAEQEANIAKKKASEKSE